MLAPRDSWVWDSWPADDGERHHLFFLFASKALHDPDLRHGRAGIGHAVSDDLVRWERVEDALVHGDPGDFDALATWTGSVVRAPDGVWHLLYTGLAADGVGTRQTIGRATSRDLLRWEKRGAVLGPDPRWYADGVGAAWRDPWVVREGDRWRMLVTAHARGAAPGERGVIGTAVSDDLSTWTAEAPLTPPGRGFDHLEVPSTAEVDGRRWLVFSCLGAELAERRRAGGGGIWAVPDREAGDGPRWDPGEATLLTGEDRYACHVVRERRSGRPVLLAFRNRDPASAFRGGIIDPVPVTAADGPLRLLER